MAQPQSAKGKEKASKVDQILESKVGIGINNYYDLLMCSAKSKIESTNAHLVRTQIRDELAVKALCGIIKVDLQGNPPAELTFGDWNPWRIDSVNLNKMVEEFGTGQSKPWTTPLVMIASEDDFVNGQKFCSTSGFQGQTMEDVTALPQLVPKLKIKYRMAGGRHRFEAAQKAFETIGKNIKGLQGQLEGIEEERVREGEEDQTKHHEAKAKCQKDIKLLEEWSNRVWWWPVKVYTSGLFFCVQYLIFSLAH